MSISKATRCFAVTLVICLLVLAAGCITIRSTIGSGPAVTGSGTLETRDMEYSDFTKIEVAYAFQVDITEADSFSVSITLNDNLFEYLDIAIRGDRDTLYIGLEPGHSYRNITHRATITMPNLRGLELSMASRADVEGFSSADPLQIEASAASRVTMGDVEAGQTTL
ncbi:MAG: GIN domain-containing protein, partial [Candidatus Thorarchaeota archaeon]